MKFIYLFSACVIFLIIACTSKKSTVSSVNESINFEAQATSIKTRFSDVTAEELKTGHSVYTGACTKCHGQKNVVKYTEESLFKILDNMSKKAKITDAEKQALQRYCLAIRATNTK
jgi:cytochrome c1